MNQTIDTAHRMFLDGRLSRTAYHVYLAIKKHVNKERVCRLRNQTILDELAEVIHERTLARAKAQLKAAGLLVVIASQRPASQANRQGGQGCNWYRFKEPAMLPEALPRVRLRCRRDGARPVRECHPPPGIDATPICVNLEEQKEEMSPLPPKRGEKVDPDTPPDRNGIDTRPPTVPASVSEVLDMLQSVGRRKDDDALPPSLLKRLAQCTTVYGPAGVVAMYRLWILTGEKWSSWNTQSAGALGAMLRIEQVLINDARWPALRRKYASDLAVKLPANFKSLIGQLAGRSGP